MKKLHSCIDCYLFIFCPQSKQFTKRSLVTRQVEFSFIAFEILMIFWRANNETQSFRQIFPSKIMKLANLEEALYLGDSLQNSYKESSLYISNLVQFLLEVPNLK
ncbi:CLUMA_CG000373, isoform A [Clunio marinus]|uniref:CLUMA_CG000373, isoform A n=1 Tax=Clunio marinus TaxID=568069 RepID=A0A1J1HFB4_9DIPT|nr:CLUMA_CG000373, isoform A [Clunio marinus]